MTKELAQRGNDGISVTLYWHTGSNRLTVSVRDERTGEAFDLPAEAHDAMEVFHHPFAYAAAAGLDVAAPREAVYA